jgi:two-component sensor histidine kinase
MKNYSFCEPYFRYKWFIFFFSFTVLIRLPSLAQYEEKDFVRYTVKEGLSDNYITCLQQDDWSYVWAGTNNGLNRFDGHSFNNFYQGTPALPLSSIDIRKIKRFGPHKLGILGGGGMDLINTGDFSLQKFHIPDSTAFTTYRNAVWDAVELPDHSYALTTASGLYVFKKPGIISFRHDAFKLEDVGKKRILYGRDIFPISSQKQVVYYGDSGIALYDIEKKTYRETGKDEKEFNFLSPPGINEGGQWITKYQLNNHEFIFIFLRKDSIAFYNHQLQKAIISPLPFQASSVFSWESKIEKLDDTSFVVNDRARGFYLFHLDRQTGQIVFNKKRFLSSYKITCLFLDRDKRLWIGTNEGLLQQKLNSPMMSAYHYPSLPVETLTGGFTCTYRYKNNLYAGRFSLYKGLVILDPVSMQVKKQVEFYGGNNAWNEIYSMEMYHPDTLWIGTNAGLLWLDTRTNNYGKVMNEKKYPAFKESLSILAPSHNDGYAWMCGMLNGLVARYHISSRTFTFFTSKTQPALPFDEVKNIVYDSYGDVWISGHSLARWNNRLQLFDTLITVYGGVNKFYENILTFSADDNGSLWLHNGYNGLLEYRIKEKKFIPYSRKDGLPSDVLQSFSPVIDNTLWIESNNSLIQFDTRTKKIIVYDYNDGMPESKPTGRKMWFDKESQFMYMYCNEYLVKFPVQPVKSYDSSSQLLVQDMVINNEKVFFQPGNEIELKHNENNLSLSYTIIDFEKNDYQFAYKLNGARTWTTLGGQRNITLNNLQPGKYIVQLKATGKSGNEKLTAFAVLIKPPFWKTSWFIIACASLLAAMLYYLYRYRIKQIRQKANIDKLLAQTEMKALHSQMNPHFIFNSLNSIREMILNNENKEASHYLSKFAQLIRITLDHSGQSFISLRNTLDYLRRYIEMEKIRNSYFTYYINVDKHLDMDETVLPPMLIQPFIENAIWHGVTGSRKDISIKIDFKKQNGQMICTIDDNGVGIEHSMKNKNNNDLLHNPFGITNVRNRIRLLNEKHNLKSAIIINDKMNIAGAKETGTLITLRLPLEINENEKD